MSTNIQIWNPPKGLHAAAVLSKPILFVLPVWVLVLAQAAWAECFTVTELNADFLDDSSCFVTFPPATPKKTMHPHSCGKADASWMGIELVLICWCLSGNRALWNPSWLSEERRHFPPLLSIHYSISIAYWNDRVSKRLQSWNHTLSTCVLQRSDSANSIDGSYIISGSWKE